MAGSSPFTVMTNILVTEFTEFSETIQGKLKFPRISGDERFRDVYLTSMFYPLFRTALLHFNVTTFV